MAGLNVQSALSKGSALTCAEIELNWQALRTLTLAVCNGPTRVHLNSHSSATLTIPGNDLPTATPSLIKVFTNGLLEYNNAESGLTNGYTVDGTGQISLSYTPSNANILVEYWVIG